MYYTSYKKLSHLLYIHCTGGITQPVQNVVCMMAPYIIFMSGLGVFERREQALNTREGQTTSVSNDHYHNLMYNYCKVRVSST